MTQNEKEDKFESLYDIAQRRFEQSGLNVNFEAFLPKQCYHMGKRTITTQIVIELDVTQEEVVFEVLDKKCLNCGKTIQLKHKRLFYSQEQINGLRNTIKTVHSGNRTQKGGELRNGT